MLSVGGARCVTDCWAACATATLWSSAALPEAMLAGFSAGGRRLSGVPASADQTVALAPTGERNTGRGYAGFNLPPPAPTSVWEASRSDAAAASPINARPKKTPDGRVIDPYGGQPGPAAAPAAACDPRLSPRILCEFLRAAFLSAPRAA